MLGRLPITVRCDCGRARPLGYGEVWTCEGCGRRWNTAQIPEEDYRRVAREVARYRSTVIAVAAVVVAVLVPLGVLVSVRFFFLMPVVLVLWGAVVAPFWKRRLGRRLGKLPSWQLRPE